MAAKRQYWLAKSEPSAYGIEDLRKDGITYWDGVRNYQARNFMRDTMREGDLVLFYHSNANPPAVAGVARVCREGYPDFTAWDKRDEHYDPKSDKDDPTWIMVDLAFVEAFDEPVPLDRLRAEPSLDGLLVIRRGQRLSIQPVELKHFRRILKMAGARTRV